MKGHLLLKKNILIILLALLVSYGCQAEDSQLTAPGTAKVTPEQAKELAKDAYGVSEMEELELRLLTESELEYLTEEQLNFTPVYYVIDGTVENQHVKVFISSNEITHHFINDSH